MAVESGKAAVEEYMHLVTLEMEIDEGLNTRVRAAIGDGFSGSSWSDRAAGRVLDC